MKTAEPVAEIPFWLEVNGRRVATWTCSPGAYRELALGRLVAEGYIPPVGPVPELDLVDDGWAAGVRVQLPEPDVARAEVERRHRQEHGCGVLHFATCEPAALKADRRGVPEGDWPGLFAVLYGDDRSGSGLHAAALSDGEVLKHRIEEVGRHNAVDKVVGAALLAGESLAGLGLVISARISGDMALKASRAGLSWIVTRSVPTTLALTVAASAGLAILARARGPEAHLFDPRNPRHAGGPGGPG
ncbi:MAG: formate dehydrogenase accessory sulfurtransferase FdhD [Gemmatimonadota bacterium]|jgi:FdhD protein